jgi:hypothetical protein
MWIPRDTTEIESAIARGDLEETDSFDGKESLPATKKQNPSLAIDVAAMSTAGGVLLYGVGEDQHERLTVRAPFDLTGASDRVDQIVQTSISEVPHIEFRRYELPGEPNMGYLLVIVPPSPRAPHQVTVGEDRRFYGRGAKGNRRLTEQEIGLLYTRRNQQAINLEARLAEVVGSTRYQPVVDYGYVYAFVQPVPPSLNYWENAVTASNSRELLQQRLVSAIVEGPVVRGGHDPDLRARAAWHAEGADAWQLSSQYESRPKAEYAPYLVEITLNVDGRAVLFSGNAAIRRSDDPQQPAGVGRKYIREGVIAGNVAAFFAFMAEFFRAAGYFGAVDCGVLVTGLDEGYSIGRVEDRGSLFVWGDTPDFNADRYSRVRQLSAVSELADVERLTLDLFERLFEATTKKPGYTPFE